MTNDPRLTDRAIATALSVRLARTAPPGLLDSAMARIANTPQRRPGLGRLAAQPFGVVRLAWILILLALFAAMAVTFVAVGSRPLSVATVVNGRIAFAPANGDGIRVIDPDGTNETRLVDGTVSSPRWSPDGRRIAFVRLVDAENFLFELFVLDADGANERQLTSGSAGPMHSLAWAPDGSRIAFVYEPTTDDPDVSITQRQIRVVPVETGEPLTVYQHQMALIGGWSPDGTRLLVYPEGVWDDGGIFAAQADGSSVKQLTEGSGVEVEVAGWTPGGGYSPDGSRILFSTGKNGLDRIEVMNADGSQRHFLTDAGTVSEFQPTWSRDGQRIAYSRWEPGATEESRRSGWEDVGIWVMNADGTGLTRLAPGHDPTFSPDAERIVFYRDDEPGVYVMNSRDGSGIAKLIDEHAFVHWQAAWR
jgi:Tol biopolymer transport system component